MFDNTAELYLAMLQSGDTTLDILKNVSTNDYFDGENLILEFDDVSTLTIPDSGANVRAATSSSI